MDLVYQYQEVLDRRDFHEQAEFLQKGEWKFENKSDQSDPNSLTFWMKKLSDDKFFTEHLFDIIKNLIKDIGFDVELLAVYANGQTFGQSGTLHQDCEDDRHWTFLMYFNHNWDIHWGGHTILKDLNEDKFYSFLPVPNSAIFYRGDLWHVGLEPTRTCPILRTSVAYKLKRIN